MRALFIGLMASMAVTVPAHAGSTQPVEVRIPYGDLDLATATGVAKLKQRSETAIRRACAPDPFDHLQSPYLEQRCRIDAMADANVQIERQRQTTVALMTIPRS